MGLLSHPAVLRGLLGGAANAAQGFAQERDLRRQANRTRATEDYRTRLGMMEKDWEQARREQDPLYQAQLQNTLAQGGLIQAQTSATEALGQSRKSAGPLSEALKANKEEAQRLKDAQKAKDKAAREAERAEGKRQKAQDRLEEKSLELQGKEHALRVRIGQGEVEKITEYAIANPEVLATPTWIHYQNTKDNPAGAASLGEESAPLAPVDLTGIKGAPVILPPRPVLGGGRGAGNVDPLTGAGGSAAIAGRDMAQRSVLKSRAMAPPPQGKGMNEVQAEQWLSQNGW